MLNIGTKFNIFSPETHQTTSYVSLVLNIYRNLLTKDEIEMFKKAAEEDDVENKSFTRPDGEGGELKFYFG